MAETTRSRQSLEVKSSSRGEVDLFCHPTVQLVLYITNNSALWEEDRADVWRKVLSHNLRVWAFENVRLADCVLESYGWHRRLKCGNEGGHLHLGINLTSTHTLLHCQCPLSKGMLKIGRSYGASFSNTYEALFKDPRLSEALNIPPCSSLSSCSWINSERLLHDQTFIPYGFSRPRLTDVSITCIFQSHFSIAGNAQPSEWKSCSDRKELNHSQGTCRRFRNWMDWIVFFPEKWSVLFGKLIGMAGPVVAKGRVKKKLFSDIFWSN